LTWNRKIEPTLKNRTDFLLKSKTKPISGLQQKKKFFFSKNWQPVNKNIFGFLFLVLLFVWSETKRKNFFFLNRFSFFLPKNDFSFFLGKPKPVFG